jgi:hypothetical protein
MDRKPARKTQHVRFMGVVKIELTCRAKWHSRETLWLPLWTHPYFNAPTGEGCMFWQNLKVCVAAKLNGLNFLSTPEVIANVSPTSKATT